MASKGLPATEKLFADLLLERNAGVRRAIEANAPPPAARRAHYGCKHCRDTKRVKVPNEIGRTAPCPSCA